ncbi:hypothetical protein [Streptomyces incanus]
MTIERTESIQSGVVPMCTRERTGKQHVHWRDVVPVERRSPLFD